MTEVNGPFCSLFASYQFSCFFRAKSGVTRQEIFVGIQSNYCVGGRNVSAVNTPNCRGYFDRKIIFAVMSEIYAIACD